MRPHNNQLTFYEYSYVVQKKQNCVTLLIILFDVHKLFKFSIEKNSKSFAYLDGDEPWKFTTSVKVVIFKGSGWNNVRTNKYSF